jgi:uroporphyrinogen-III synthase
VTRPAAQATEWVAALRARGIDALALPLIEIGPARDTAAVAAAWARLPEQRLVVFVSPNAAERFFACRPADAAWPAAALAGSPGPGTTLVLRRLGVPAERIVAPAAGAPQFDSETLWVQLARLDWAGASVLVVRGDGGREWLAERLTARGASVASVAAYRRSAPVLSAAEAGLLAAALDRPDAHLWFFSSSEAIDNLAACCPQVLPSAWRPGRALATHPRIAERARELGFADVLQTRPALSAVVACIESLRS